MKVLLVLCFVLVSHQCIGRAVDDVTKESVVSVYTTQPTTAGNTTSPSLDVYHQIANNIAERITSPIYRFLGIGPNKTAVDKTTKKPWSSIELLDESSEVGKAEIKPVDNDISNQRDVEELSTQASRRAEKKPEKITLYSSYLPSQKLEDNGTVDDGFDDFDLDFDDDDEEKPREGPFVYVLELLGSFIQLLWGGLTSLFRPSS